MSEKLYTQKQVEEIMVIWQDSGKPLAEVMASLPTDQAPVSHPTERPAEPYSTDENPEQWVRVMAWEEDRANRAEAELAMLKAVQAPVVPSVDHGRCEGCGAIIQPKEIEPYGSQWCHVVPVCCGHGNGDCCGSPDPHPCGPVHRFTDVDLLAHGYREQSEGVVNPWKEIDRLCDELKYIAGIVERGRGSPIPPDVSVRNAVLGYVKELEAKVATPPPSSSVREAVERLQRYRHRNGDGALVPKGDGPWLLREDVIAALGEGGGR